MDKVTAAIADISTCFYVHQQKVVLAGYSSGGELAYQLGLTQAAKFAGILIEDSGLNGVSPSAAAWKINVAHITHNQDGDYPLASVQADWATLRAAGIPLLSTSVDGPHDGTSTDWATWLLPKIDGWKAP
jgi:poly(3-hydroxybutyrate) depolymerase